MNDTPARPNSLAAVSKRTSEGRVAGAAPWVMLVSRLLLFPIWQAAIALVFVVLGESQPWDASAKWFPLSVTLANLTNIALLKKLAQAEGLRLRDLYGFNPSTWRADLGWTLLVAVTSVALVVVPDPILAAALWSDATIPHTIMTPTLPMWGVALAVAFPVTQALAELPNYFGYVMPRLQASTRSRWGIFVLVGSIGAAQHITMPLLFDAKFVLWRLLMFLPFSLFFAWALDRRPSLLAHLMVFHGLLDSAVVVALLLTALGLT